MATRDPIEALRLAALEGLAPRVVVPMHRLTRARSVSVPEIPENAERPTREELTLSLRHDAGRHWRRAAPPWAPSLTALREMGAVSVEVSGSAVRVTVRNATYHGVGVPLVWVPVIVAALTDRELPAVRRALAAGVTRFMPEETCPTP